MFESKLNNKLQIPKNKQYQNKKVQNTRKYDLEDRTLRYAEKVNDYVKKLPKCLSNIENSKQLIRAAGSVGANYIEANESLGKKDFAMRIKISRKEAKESRYWLYLTNPSQEEEKEKSDLIDEATELTKIFSAILLKTNQFRT